MRRRAGVAGGIPAPALYIYHHMGYTMYMDIHNYFINIPSCRGQLFLLLPGFSNHETPAIIAGFTSILSETTLPHRVQEFRSITTIIPYSKNQIPYTTTINLHTPKTNQPPSLSKPPPLTLTKSIKLILTLHISKKQTIKLSNSSHLQSTPKPTNHPTYLSHLFYFQSSYFTFFFYASQSLPKALHFPGFSISL